MSRARNASKKRRSRNKQAETKDNSQQIRDAMTWLVGNQSFADISFHGNTSWRPADLMGAGTDFLSVLGWLGWDRRFWVRLVEFMTIWAIWHFWKGIYHGNGLPKRDGEINAVTASTAEV